MSNNRTNLIAVVFCCLVSGVTSAGDESMLEGTWSVTFYDRSFRFTAANAGDDVVIDENLRLIFDKKQLTISNGKESESWVIVRCKIDKTGNGEIDLGSLGAPDKIKHQGIIRLVEKKLSFHLAVRPDNERPKNFSYKANETGLLISAKKAEK